MTNSEAVKALREEFPNTAVSRIRRSFDKAKRAGLSVVEAYEAVRAAGVNGAFGPRVIRISQADPTGHEAQMHADLIMSNRHGYGYIRGALVEV